MLKQRCDVRSKCRESEGVAWRAASTVTTQIVKQDSEPMRQKWKLVSPDLHASCQRVTQEDDRAVLVTVKRVGEFKSVNRCRGAGHWSQESGWVLIENFKLLL